MKFLIGKQKHFIVLGALVVYALIANPLYVQVFLKEGKPSAQNISLPAQTKAITYQLGDFRDVNVNGQNLKELKGYAFETSHPEQNDTIQIVLITKGGNVVYTTDSVTHPNMIESYKNYTTGMNHAEFSMLLAPEALPQGDYQVGVLLADPSGAHSYYTLTHSHIQKTPNNVKYVP